MMPMTNKARRETEVNKVDCVAMISQSEAVVVWFLVAVDKCLVMERFEACDHLRG